MSKIELLGGTKAVCYLPDVVDGEPGQDMVKVAVEVVDSTYLTVRPDGYGIWDDDDSGPMLLERQDGKLRLIVWADINSEEPTHIIDLESARVTNRTPDEEG